MKRYALVVILVFTISTVVYAQSITNLTVQSGEPYEIVLDLLGNGERIYIDRSYTFQSVPPLLIGATFIRTANGDKLSNSDQFLLFTVDQDVTVFVGLDIRLTIPSWLSGFTNSGWELVTNDTAFRVYQRDYGAGPVILGGNEGTQDSSMYSVAILSSASDPWPGGPSGVVSVSAVWQEFIPPSFVDISFEWDASNGADGYRLFAREAGLEYDYETPAWQGQNLACTLYNLPNIDLYFVIRAYNQYGVSNNSNEVFWDGEN